MVFMNGVYYICKSITHDTEYLIGRFERIFSLAQRIGIKPTVKFARRLKFNTMKRDNKICETPKQYIL